MVHTEWTRESTPDESFKTAGRWIENAIDEGRPVVSEDGVW
jgi:hypothetical protein